MKVLGDKSDTQVLENRKNFLQNLGISENLVVSARLCHSDQIKVVRPVDGDHFIDNVDGLITNERGLFLSVTVADCLPVYFFDPVNHTIGIAHAGWRGLAAGILENMVEKFKQEYNSELANILVGIGPAICQKCYEVGEEVANQFQQYINGGVRLAEISVLALKQGESSNRYFLNLKEIAQLKLMDAGITEKNIEISPECTSCLKEKYFSFRRDKPKNVQAMMAVIGMYSK